jgi:hypothetical protein
MNKFVKVVKGFAWYNLGILEKIFFWKTNKYINKYYTVDAVKSDSTNRTIIYMLDGRAYSGGISDIIRGIISMFMLSKEIGYDFKINFCYPYHLTDYLVPNEHNWIISTDEVSYNLKSSKALWLYSVHNNYGKSREFEVKYQRKLIKNFIRRNSSFTQLHIYTNSDWAQGFEYSRLFKMLFKPSNRLQDVLNKHKSSLGENYVSMTFRFQQLLGDFVASHVKSDKTMRVVGMLKLSDSLRFHDLPEHGIIQLRALLGDFRSKSISTPLNASDSSFLMGRCIEKVIDIRSELGPETRVLITADSVNFLNEIKNLHFVYAITSDDPKVNGGGDIIDLYYLFLKAYVDIFMIAGAQKVFLLSTGGMYKSGFAKNASLISNNSYEEVIW